MERNISNTLECLGYWTFIGIINSFEAGKFQGISDKFDFFSDMENFNYKKFEPSWLNEFSVAEVHRNISNNDTNTYIKELLKEYLKKPDFEFNKKNGYYDYILKFIMFNNESSNLI